MTDAKTFHFHLITPDRKVLECEALSASIPGHDGEFGFRKLRAPLMCKLGAGELRVETPDDSHRYFLDGGFAHMLENELTVMTQSAEPADQIDREKAQADLGDALAMTAPDAAAREQKDAQITRARARLHVVSKQRL